MKVFISSTYKDLIDYRAAAIRAVERIDLIEHRKVARKSPRAS